MTARTFVMVCADGPDRERMRRVLGSGGLDVADGFDRVELLVLATAERALRGLTIDSWAVTDLAIEWLRDRPAKAERVQAALTVRARR